MKKIRRLGLMGLMIATLATAWLMAGCATNTNSAGQTVSVTFLGVTIYPTNAYTVVKDAARTGTQAAINADSFNTNYLQAVYQELNQELASTNFDPGELEAALDSIAVKVGISNPLDLTLTTTVFDAAFGLFDGLTAEEVQSSAFLLPIFTGLRDGIGQALGIPPSAQQTRRTPDALAWVGIPFLFWMKGRERRKGRLVATTLSLVALTGCTLAGVYPKTKITGTLNGQPFSLSAPKDYDINGLDVSIDTNGAFHLTIQSLKANLIVSNINAVASGEAQIVTATGAVAHQAVQDAISGAVQLGAKAITP